MYLAYNTAAIEQLNKPAVLLVNKSFTHDARTGVSVRDVPMLRFVESTIPCEVGADNVEEIRAGVSALLDDLVDAMTRPLTAEEKSPKLKEVEKPSRIVFKGNLQEVNRFFYKRGWSHGFPIIPPTEEAVKEMLTGTELPADHVVAKIPPRLGKATVEKIAINAVMAGALPTYMPVLIAAVKALTGPSMRNDAFSLTTISAGPLWVINGPIRHDLHVNSGLSLLSPDYIANAAIANTMGLIIRNISGARPGVEIMSVFGDGARYSKCMAENEEESPWEPLHVDQGLNKEDSAVTLFFSNSFHRFMPYGIDVNGILRGFVYDITDRDGGIIMTPAVAKSLAEAGWTKELLASYIAEYARMPGYRHPRTAEGVHRWFMPREKWPADPMFSVPILNRNQVQFIVAGGTSELYVMLRCFVPNMEYGGPETQKVELPANWDELVKKYKDVVPTYAPY